ncbi:nicotinic acid mononucleotide adenylyltransferase [Brevirhabdus pacifica]|uniref:Probable nicotinate-nucleotide adenylyltransferase n=1 Tax=Brevirhabdus pacifica TaxID=1267768 RepID=A0A1U7DGJ1_9RHOB|nr:nicotinic acid mononucleotide adenylyltransferase [Brevirhabdus pacifica]PJJ86290.1 nicotinate-nucleotide adenylyltransferase [Brevirhabdus pacifica]
MRAGAAVTRPGAGSHPFRHRFPVAARGQVIGLLGGSFDPAHEGHAHITRMALRRFALDRVWWMVSPGNPLKAKEPAALERRLAAARRVMDHPRVTVTDVEALLGTRHTAQTLRRLRRLYPGVTFVWLMGADNLAGLHRWQDWRWIMENVPVGVIARPGSRTAARASPAAQLYRDSMLSEVASRMLPRCDPPAWCFVNVPLNDASSSRIRAGGGWR